MVYNYTKPRQAIASMYNSPGPCYALPSLTGQTHHDPRSVHYRKPAYVFGIRHGKLSDDCSPGPMYNPPPNIDKNGQQKLLSYSVYGRPKDGTQFKTPGPGAYSPEQTGPSAKYQHPSYSFGTRHRQRRLDNTPAANKYSLPDVLGKTKESNKRTAPCYSMNGRSNVGSFCEDLSKTPGPGTYRVCEPAIYKDKSPHYSMTSRNVMPGDTTKKPGPGAHFPERVKVTKRQGPAFSFGIHHSQYEAPLIVEVQEEYVPQTFSQQKVDNGGVKGRW